MKERDVIVQKSVVGKVAAAPAPNEYDRFADIYTVLIGATSSARASLPFYLDAYAAVDGPIVELGVGDGRIAVAAAQRGARVIGVDLSAAMLELCRERAAQAGVGDRLTLIQADFRSFALEQPAALICLPYRSIGHLLTLEEKGRAIRHIFSQLRPGGRFTFDDALMTPSRIAAMRQVRLSAEYKSANGGADVLLWVTSLVHEETRSIKMVTWEDEMDRDEVMVRRKYRRLSLSWLEPTEARSLLEEAGFSIEACFGDFTRTPFDEATAEEHIWIARKP
jgi:SAM-dependent methyltransferase